MQVNILEQYLTHVLSFDHLKRPKSNYDSPWSSNLTKLHQEQIHSKQLRRNQDDEEYIFSPPLRTGTFYPNTCLSPCNNDILEA